ncbi:hypothetical protein RRU01S_19_00780 [Agrobacterium rubi TR3 = NBRC 13261]|uniref:Uncharacterized protein n=1 Tax=Agrobacterium rubi TR3 = NBRC 13261 TaxID=1368415 RepID=A0A081CYC7_9HYPH|nr:hypothetical protein RRU01S_19_00780 [Agrobacterium rubi TR3 = NBRC 13261]
MVLSTIGKVDDVDLRFAKPVVQLDILLMAKLSLSENIWISIAIFAVAEGSSVRGKR